MDVVFIIDTVTNVGTVMWNEVVKLIKSVIIRLDVNEYGTHVAVMTYTNDWVIVKSLEGSTRLQLVLTTYNNGRRKVSSAIRKTCTDILNRFGDGYYSTGDRAGVPDVMVIFMGGPSSNATATSIEAEVAKSYGIKIITVGVGPDGDVDELKNIATNATEAERLHVVAPENVTALFPTLLEYIRDLVVDIPDLGK